jgi:ribosomal protein L17
MIEHVIRLVMGVSDRAGCSTRVRRLQRRPEEIAELAVIELI